MKCYIESVIKETRTHIQNQINVQCNRKKCVKILNLASIINDYTNWLNNIFDISDELKKKFNNRNVSMIDKFYDLYSERKHRLFLNNFFNYVHSLNNFSKDTASSFQQIILDTLLFFI